MKKTDRDILSSNTYSADRDFTRSESSESPAEIYIYNIDAKTDSVVYTKTRIDVELSPDHYRDRETGSTLMALSISGEESYIPPLKITLAWSPLEKRQLRAFLSTRGHLSWSRIAGRSPSSISGPARCLSLSIRPSPASQARSASAKSPFSIRQTISDRNASSSQQKTVLAKKIPE
ncbi:hypothetical protein N7489_003559 [Penicillium chrysogenum]|uniref:uncharacterized protein n=1 Tax=Penicillium chrysogenum TaxID=5076 RepID=UPI0024DF26FA|nr:uncharacterized protein N7489_003559 [Penicillium chrysogenum]KAJ5253149.1 hypothetical protein N7489_003559 [Penicillium chrysogenum]